MFYMKALHMIAFILLVVGGLNWGLYAATGGTWEVGQLLGGMTSGAAMVVYALVGLAAVYEVVTHPKSCKACKPAGTM